MEPSSGYVTQSRDTDPEVERRMFAYWATLEPREKARIVTQMYHAARRLSLAGLRLRHPDASDEELELRAACLRLGRDMVERALGRKLEFMDAD